MSQLDLEVFCQSTTDQTVVPGCFAGHGDDTYLQWLFRAWGWTLTVALAGLVIALVIGTVVGILRTLPNRGVRAAGEAWTEFFRNIPLVVQLLMWFQVMPAIFPALRGLPDVLLASLGLGFFTSARIAQQVKAGIETLPKGQRHAGLALGLTLPQTYRFVLLPVALRVVLPTLTSESMNIIKNSSVASVVNISELVFFAGQAGEETSRHLLMYGAVTVLYFISAFSVNRLAAVVERRTRLPGQIGGAR